MSGQNNADINVESNALLSVVKVGALSGTAGLIYGGTAGVIRSPNPVVHSLTYGIHYFACGSAFWWLRSNIIKLHFRDQVSPREQAYVSALSGGIAGGGITKLMGGRLVPAVIMFSLLGYCGQTAFNKLDDWQLGKAQSPSKPITQQMAESKWIPLRHLSDDEYRGILSEKLLSIEAEISLLDDKIEELKKSRSLTTSDPK